MIKLTIPNLVMALVVGVAIGQERPLDVLRSNGCLDSTYKLVSCLDEMEDSR